MYWTRERGSKPNQQWFRNDQQQRIFLNDEHIPSSDPEQQRRLSENFYFTISANKLPPHPSRQSRMTNVKSDGKKKQVRSHNPTLSVSNYSQIEGQYREVEKILNEKNQNLQMQNQFLKEQVHKLFEREQKYISKIKKYKEKLHFLSLQNEVYKGRYLELKTYIQEVIGRITTCIPQENDYEEEKVLIQQCSQELQNKLQSQFFWENQQFEGGSAKRIRIEQNVFHPLQSPTDSINQQKQKQQQKKQEIQGIQQSLKLMKKYLPPSPPLGRNKEKYHKQLISPPIEELKDEEQEQTSETAHRGEDSLNREQRITKQIQQLNDQSQALIYELKKSGNQDQEIRKKIIRISHKIKQLEIEKELLETEKQKTKSSPGKHKNKKFKAHYNS